MYKNWELNCLLNPRKPLLAIKILFLISTELSLLTFIREPKYIKLCTASKLKFLIWKYLCGQHNSPAYLLPGKGLPVPSKSQSWDDLREQWIQCLLPSGEIRMAFEAVSVTGVHTTVGRNRKLRFGCCCSAVVFYCSLSVVLRDSEHFSAALAFALRQRYVYGSHCTPGGEGAFSS